MLRHWCIMGSFTKNAVLCCFRLNTHRCYCELIYRCMFVSQTESQGWEWIFLFFRRWSDFAEGSVSTGKLDPSCCVSKKLKNRLKAALCAHTQSHTFACNDCVWVYLCEPDECIVNNWIAHQREEMCTKRHTSTWRDPINTNTDKKRHDTHSLDERVLKIL